MKIEIKISIFIKIYIIIKSKMRNELRNELLNTKVVVKNSSLRGRRFEVQTLDQNQFKTDWKMYSVYLEKDNAEYMRIEELDDLIRFLSNNSKNSIRVVFYSNLNCIDAKGAIEKSIIIDSYDLEEILMDIIEEEVA